MAAPQVDVLDYQLLYTSFFTESSVRNLNTPDPSTGLLGASSGCCSGDVLAADTPATCPEHDFYAYDPVLGRWRHGRGWRCQQYPLCPSDDDKTGPGRRLCWAFMEGTSVGGAQMDLRCSSTYIITTDVPYRFHKGRQQSHTLSAGLLRVLGCISNATAVHLFGFNWSAKHYFTHQMSVCARTACRIPSSHRSV